MFLLTLSVFYKLWQLKYICKYKKIMAIKIKAHMLGGHFERIEQLGEGAENQWGGGGGRCELPCLERLFYILGTVFKINM